MKIKFSKTLLLVGLAVAGAMFALFLIASSEPVWNGHPAGYWFEQSFVATNYAKASQAFKEMGGKSVPFLIEKLAEDDSWRRKEYKRVWLVLPKPIQSRLPIPRSIHEQKIRAAMLLGAIGPAAAPALPALMNAAQHRPPDPPRPKSAVPGAPARFPPVVALATTNSPRIFPMNGTQLATQSGTMSRTNAAGIAGVVQKSGTVFPSSMFPSAVISEIPSNPPVSFSSRAQLTLRTNSLPLGSGYVARTAPMVRLPTVRLSDSVTFDSTGVSVGAIQTIGKIGSSDPATYAFLLKQMNDPRLRVQFVATDAVQEIADRAHLKTHELATSLNDWRYMRLHNLRSSSQLTDELIESIMATIPNLIPYMLEWLRTGELPERRLAARALGGVSAPSDTVIDALVVSMAGRDEPVQSAAMDSLVRLAAVSDRVVIGLIPAATHPQPAVRANFGHVLARIGSRANALLPQLRTLTNDPDSIVRREAALAIWNVDHDGSEVLRFQQKEGPITDSIP